MSINELIDTIEDAADLYDDDSAGACGASARLSEAARILRDAHKAGFITDDGQVRKVLGTLPLTADGCVVGVMPNRKAEERQCRECGQMHDPLAVHLWHPKFDGPAELSGDYIFVGSTDRPTCEFYGTKAAAEAARGEKS